MQYSVIRPRAGEIVIFNSDLTDRQATIIVCKRVGTGDLKDSSFIRDLIHPKRRKLSHPQRSWLHYYATSQDLKAVA